jgi:hypothetical protein
VATIRARLVVWRFVTSGTLDLPAVAWPTPPRCLICKEASSPTKSINDQRFYSVCADVSATLDWVETPRAQAIDRVIQMLDVMAAANTHACVPNNIVRKAKWTCCFGTPRRRKGCCPVRRIHKGAPTSNLGSLICFFCRVYSRVVVFREIATSPSDISPSSWGEEGTDTHPSPI